MKSCYTVKVSDTKIAILDNCDYYALGRIITRVNTPEEFRQQGHGNELMRKICKDADEEGVNLFLEISPTGDMTYDQLEKWYNKFGFKKWRGIYRRTFVKEVQSGHSD